MRQCTEWQFKTLDELNKFVKKFYEIQKTFFPDNTLETKFVHALNDIPAFYLATLKDKPVTRDIECEKVDNYENMVGAYDTVSFIKQTESSQSPDRHSYMRTMKKSMVKESK